MDRERVIDDMQQLLTQIAGELEASAAGAKAAAGALPDRARAWPSLQTMYARLLDATFLVNLLQQTVEVAERSDASSSYESTEAARATTGAH